jgi:uncharacterized HhH-GPD family protein
VAHLAELAGERLPHHAAAEDGNAHSSTMHERMPDALYFTNDAAANELIAQDPLALLIGFVLDQQVSAQTAFVGPRKLEERLGRLDAAEIAGMDPGRLEEVFREKPAIHRFPGNMARRVQELCATIVSEYGGDAASVWTGAKDAADLRKRIGSLPGFGQMKITALGAVLAKRFDVAAAKGLVPNHPTLGDVDSREKMEAYQEAKRAHKAKMRAQT